MPKKVLAMLNEAGQDSNKRHCNDVIITNADLALFSLLLIGKIEKIAKSL